MEDRRYYIKISPEVIKNDIFQVVYNSGTFVPIVVNDECCDVTTTTTTLQLTGSTFVYSSMTQILSGGTNGSSLLTGLTVPILLTQNTVDIGYYSVFDGLVTQKDVMTNFLFSATTGSPTTYYFYNTSDKEFKKYLDFSSYVINWGDGSPQELVTTNAPNFYQHLYTLPPGGQQVSYTISMSGMSPWGWNVITKNVYVPFTGMTIDNPNGNAVFYPLGGNWSGTPISYDYIFSGDSECITDNDPLYSNVTVPFIISGYTKSSVNDLQVYGPVTGLTGGRFRENYPVSGVNDTIGVYLGVVDGIATAYTINDITYYDYPDGTTIFIVESSGLTGLDLICSAITKDEVLLNVIDEPQVQSNVYVERGKMSGLEALQRIGEVDNIGDLEKYGYKFFRVIKN